MYISREAWLKRQELDKAIQQADEIPGCTNDPDAWYASENGGIRENYQNIKLVKQVCNQCPVKLLCLDFAITNDEQYGIWGGMTPRERVTFRSLNRITKRGNTKVTVTIEDFCSRPSCHRLRYPESSRNYCDYHDKHLVICKVPDCERELSTRVHSGLCAVHREAITICNVANCSEPTIQPRQAKRCEDHYNELPDCSNDCGNKVYKHLESSLCLACFHGR